MIRGSSNLGVSSSLTSHQSTLQHSNMSPVIKTRCCECGRKIRCSAKYDAKLYSCNKCSMPQCPSCNGVDIIYKVVIFKGKKTTIVKKCLDVECQWSSGMTGPQQNKKEKTIEVITID